MKRLQLKPFIWLSLILVTQLPAISQTVDLKNFDYSKADSIALHFPKKKYKATAEIVGPLIKDLTTEHERARAIYRWVTDNIAYSFSNRSSNPQKVLIKRKAVCAGYATLLNQMLAEAGIRSKVISGNSKTEASDIGQKIEKSDHAWNAIYLQGEWHLTDATWSAGFYDKKKRKFTKDYQELYYLTPPEVFIKNHFPEEKEWQLLEEPVSKRDFIKSPLYYSTWFECEFTEKNFKKGLLNFRVKDTLAFHFSSECEISSLILQLNDEEMVYSPKIDSLNDNYWIRQKFQRPGNYTLTVFANGISICAYKLKIRK